MTDTEAAVRQRYRGWARSGLALLEELPDHAERQAIWLEATAAARNAPSIQMTADVGAAEFGRERGWLVSGPVDTGQHDGPLAGVAVAVKDNIDVAGLPTRNGTPGGLWRFPDSSAPAWDRLERSGAWCAGKAAMHEMAWGVRTATIPGPHDEERMTGGSSGGSAALVAAGVTPAALGTDTGGSIRIPAALCGVVGLRPTHGAVSTEGVTPLAPAQDVVGPIAADVVTAALVFEVLSGRPIIPANDGISGLRVGTLKRLGRLEPEVAAAYTTTLAALADAGAVLVEVDTALPRVAASVSLLRMLVSADALHGDTVRRDPGSYGPEARALLTLGAEFRSSSATLDRAGESVKIGTAELFRHHLLDVLVTPTCPCAAPRRAADTVDIGGREEHVDAALTRFTAWSAVTGLPALSVPVPASVPPAAGVQIMAAPDREVDCIRTALIIEQKGQQ